MEHAYAPTYSSAKDPVNIAGFVAENILEARVRVGHWDALSREEIGPGRLVYVPEPDEFALDHIECATNIPLDEL
jgi:hypothetical protein